MGTIGWTSFRFELGQTDDSAEITFDPQTFTWPHDVAGLTVLRTRVYAWAWWSANDAAPFPGTDRGFVAPGLSIAFSEDADHGGGHPPDWPGGDTINTPPRYKPTVDAQFQPVHQVMTSIDMTTGIGSSWQTLASLDAVDSDTHAERRFDGGRSIMCWCAVGAWPNFITTIGSSPDLGVSIGVRVLLKEHL